MKDTIFNKDGEQKIVKKATFNPYAFLFSFIYFAYKGDKKFSALAAVFCLVATYAYDGTFAAILTGALFARIANLRLRKLYMEQGYIA